MGYYSDMDIRLTEAGLQRGSPAYDQAAFLLDMRECQGYHDGVRCFNCPDRNDPGCPWIIYGKREVQGEVAA